MFTMYVKVRAAEKLMRDALQFRQAKLVRGLRTLVRKDSEKWNGWVS